LKDFYDSEIRNKINRINQGFTWQLPNSAYFALAMCQSILNLLATTITIGFAVWWLLPIFAVLLIPMLLHESRMNKIGWFVFSSEGDGQHIFWGLMSTFNEVKRQFEVRAIVSQYRLLSKLDALNQRFYRKQMELVASHNRLGMLAVGSQFIREAIAQSWLLHQALTKPISVENYLFYVSMVFRLDGALSGTFSTLAQMQAGIKFSADYRSFLAIKPEIVDKDGATVLEKSAPSIEFISASFKYPNSKKYIFKNLNLKIDAGTKVALVGVNGAGKSTIIKLLLRFYRLESGTILVNGIDINDIAIDSLLSQLAVLFQEFNQYTMTAKENISVSEPKTVMKRVKEAARLSGADGFIEELPQGYNTYLNPALENGVELSGGQWQKVALARAFYREANMIVLDEPTSAIDAKAEFEIFNNIFSQHDGKTAVIVSHRFSTVRKADRIVVLNKGIISEDGTHEELIALNGLYADMFERQAAGYR
jgi:ATP-binding cassette subfamily B protein